MASAGGASSSNAASQPATASSSISAMTESAPPSAKLTEIEKPRDPADAKQIKELKKDGLAPSGKILKNKDGSFQQLKVDPNGPLGKFDAAKHDGKLPAGWTKKDAAKAQQFTANFLIQNAIDSPARGDSAKLSSVADALKGDLDPAFRSEMLTGAKIQSSTYILNESWSQNEQAYVDKGYKYKEDGAPRILDSNIKVLPTQYFNKGIYFTFAGTYTMSGADKAGNSYVEKHNIHYGFTTVKKNRKFFISGIQGSIYPGGVETSEMPMVPPVKVK